MKHLQILFVLLVICLTGFSQNQDNSPASIRAQMAAIRKNTAWNDPVAAKAANAKIQELAARLTQALRQVNPNASQIEGMTKDEAADVQKESDDFNNSLWNQMMKIAREGGKWDMAEPLREEIVQEYKDDEDPTIKNAEWLQSMSFLLINLSLPQVQVIIDQMPLYKGIKTLIITSEKPVSNIGLEKILDNAKDYPLEDLYIINFGPALTSLPSALSMFPNLKFLAVYNNGITALPASISTLTGLSSLQIQDNPISTVLPELSSLKNLKEMGIQKTKLTETEIARIQKALPECKITAE